MELKTEIVDVGELLATLNRKVRLAPQIARDAGLVPGAVSTCLIIAEGRTNRRRVQANASLLRSALPHDGRRFSHWINTPSGAVSAVVFWPETCTRGFFGSDWRRFTGFNGRPRLPSRDDEEPRDPV